MLFIYKIFNNESQLITLAFILIYILYGTLTAQQREFPHLSGMYFGQQPPGTIPEKFAPGIISTEKYHDFKGTFSPDGKEYYFCRHSLPSPELVPTLFFTRIINGRWTEPAPFPAARGAQSFHPFVSADNQWLFINRRFNKGDSMKSGYYAYKRNGSEWSVPEYAGPGMFVTADNSGNYYATEIVPGNPVKFYLNKFTFKDGRFTDYKRVDIQKHFGIQTHPCIAPDGSYLIFDIEDKESRMYVCFNEGKDKWGEPIDLTEHGIMKGARGGYISPDGKYLFFGYEGDIWWVNISIINRLRKK